MLTLRFQHMMINRRPYLCPECRSMAFTLDAAGFIDALPVRGNCWHGHTWEEPLITTGVLKRIRQVSTGRRLAGDEDTFELIVGGAVLTGTLHPEVVLDDVKMLGRTYWKRIIKPAARRRRRAAGRALTRPLKKAVAATQATALSAAWGLQAGGHQPDPDHQPAPVNPCGAGCDGGYFHIESRIHAVTSVKCTACRGTGEAD